MIPSLFFALSKGKEVDSSDYLTDEEEIQLNHIFLNLYSSLREKRPAGTDAESLEEMVRYVKKAAMGKEAPEELLDDLMADLDRAGFKMKDQDPQTVLWVLMMYMEETVRNLSKRPGALNCYDYVRLKDEVSRLTQLTDSFRIYCRTLRRLIKEVEEAERDTPEYPVRPFPFRDVKSKKPYTYQCLRMLDEILYTVPQPVITISTDFYSGLCMEDLLRRQCRRYGIEYRKLSKDEYKRLFVILRNLIRVEYTGDDRQAYANDGVYEYNGSGNGHKYARMRNGDQPVTAFKLCFSFAEAMRVKNEMGSVIDAMLRNGEIQDRNSFRQAFPMLTAFAEIDSYDPSTPQGRDRLLSTTAKEKASLYLLRYRSAPPSE